MGVSEDLESGKKSKARFRNTKSLRYSNTRASTKQNSRKGFKQGNFQLQRALSSL